MRNQNFLEVKWVKDAPGRDLAFVQLMSEKSPILEGSHQIFTEKFFSAKNAVENLKSVNFE